MSLARRVWSVAVLMAGLGAPLPAAPAPEGRWAPIDGILRQAGRDQPGGVRRYSWPRTDLSVELDGIAIEPALALGSWAAFVATGDAGEAVAMGDLVVTGTEVDSVVRQLQSSGLEVLAIHNHLSNESPRLLYVHFHAHGPAEAIARGVRSSLAKTKTPLEASAPARVRELSTPQKAAFERIQTVLGRPGTINATVLQLGVPRAEKIEEGGIEVPPAMGVASALNFQITGERVAATGDFVLTAEEVNPVIRELQSHGLAVTALHSHMLRESPRLFFLHFWGVGAPEKVAGGLKAALEKAATRP
ncbi:MAG: DUF1259 domain-containing protein [Thermoanaerobaculia bacterium]